MNVIILIVDSLRKDYIYKYSEYLPNFIRLLNDSCEFNRTMSNANHTLPSYASLLTGYYPSEMEFTLKSQIPNEVSTLQEIFRAEGYYTSCFSGTGGINLNNGLGRGFDKLEYFPYKDKFYLNVGIKKYANPILKKLFHWLKFTLNENNFLKKRLIKDNSTEQIVNRIIDSIKTNENNFILTNFFDAHSPYYPPSEIYSEFVTKSMMKKVREVNLCHYTNILNTYKLDKEKLVILSKLYLSELILVDKEIGRLIDKLKILGKYEDSLIIFMADHGELIGEDGLLGHWHVLNFSVLNIPLAIKFPYRRKKLDDFVLKKTIAQPSDIFNFLVEYMEFDNVEKRREKSLLNSNSPHLNVGVAEQLDNPTNFYKGRPGYKRFIKIFPQLDYSAWAIRVGDIQYVNYSNGREEVYSVSNGIAKAKEVDSKKVAKFKRLRETFLDKKVSGKKATKENQEEIIKKLKDLGYM